MKRQIRYRLQRGYCGIDSESGNLMIPFERGEPLIVSLQKIQNVTCRRVIYCKQPLAPLLVLDVIAPSLLGLHFGSILTTVLFLALAVHLAWFRWGGIKSKIECQIYYRKGEGRHTGVVGDYSFNDWFHLRQVLWAVSKMAESQD
ncbi:hypothetical protein COV04_00020 [Candidatus Uhrbacteria bacterium CG10_big_fil_rev_8_21_14_0_10_48_11]|uniref:Uncharacterized protein n=1 Tax=Candidatus Uhrbacteria bacterium CG10_big_fil_rev_8_21_14_0_10_48_11 TaxID=1975037 RepID=A0A2M8LFN8_9BACT|nr:MAG: hypothetical protein COV04_00020 [Candidatus Uhrbacteria bacterium CG10_big_fil_rev_8_21_14_0_10_48_11]